MDTADLRRWLQTTVASPGFIRATFGGPRRGEPQSPWLRAIVRRLDSKWQFEHFDEKKSFTDNVAAARLAATLDPLIAIAFSSIHITTTDEQTDIRISKKGKITLSVKRVERAQQAVPHNRTKSVPLPEGESNALLEAMGILGPDGRVKPTMRAKFTQINEFLKHLLHVLDESGLRSLGRPIEILDAGCGSSYLTLAVHHYLNSKLGLPANLIGIDVNEEVIRKSTLRAERLGADTLSFVCGRIDRASTTADVVIALHACDTATDAALAAGIRQGSKLILSVPCCHHHLNAQLKAANAGVLRPILRHGILHERQADLITDAFRALMLRIHGYRTEVVEFTSPEHTARNIMIRAVKVSGGDVTPFEEEYHAMKEFFSVTPYLECLLSASSG